jgi:hypothetical protein
MPNPQRDRLLQRGVSLLIVGVFTSWLFGLGLIFILAAAVCGFVGLFRDRVFHSALLLTLSLVTGSICALVALHIIAIAGIYAFNGIGSNNSPEVAPISAPAAEPRK